jgi:hypothetical protein
VTRRLLAVAVLALGLGIIAAPAAGSAVPTKVNAAGGDILCLYNLQPLNLGLCVSV